MPSKKNISEPLYRKIIPTALKVSWQDRWLWLFAIAVSPLMTGGIYDIILKALSDLPRHQATTSANNFNELGQFFWERFTNISNGFYFFGAWSLQGFVQVLPYPFLNDERVVVR